MLVMGIAILMGCPLKPAAIPSDQEIAENFYQNLSAYEWAAQDVLANGRIERIELGENSRLEVMGDTLEQQKAESYKHLFRDKFSIDLLDTDYKKDRYGEIGEVSFYHYRAGFVFGGDDKGIVYFVEGEPSPIVSSLDIYGKIKNKFPPSGQRIYKKLDGQWYLFYDYFD